MTAREHAPGEAGRFSEGPASQQNSTAMATSPPPSVTSAPDSRSMSGVPTSVVPLGASRVDDGHISAAPRVSIPAEQQVSGHSPPSRQRLGGPVGSGGTSSGGPGTPKQPQEFSGSSIKGDSDSNDGESSADEVAYLSRFPQRR